MTPDRMATLVGRWVQFYTRGLPEAVARRRLDEMTADLHDHIAHERDHGISDRRIASSIASRMLRGVAADAIWRRQQILLIGRETTSRSLTRSVLRVALGVAFILAIPLIAMTFRNDVAWSLPDFAVAGVLLTVIGTALELAVRRAGRRSTSLGIAIVGVAAGIIGSADDAPGLVLLGVLLIVSAGTMAVRISRRSR